MKKTLISANRFPRTVTLVTLAFARVQLSFFMSDDPCYLNPTAELDALIDIYFLVNVFFQPFNQSKCLCA